MTHSLDGHSLNDIVAPLLQKLSPVRRKTLLRKIITQLRDSNQQRIKAQENPDGSPFAPRVIKENVKGLRHKRGPMFSKLRLNKHLKLQVNSSEATLGFSGRTSLIARQHQEGIADTSGARTIPTTKRQLLGITVNDEQEIIELIIKEIEMA